MYGGGLLALGTAGSFYQIAQALGVPPHLELAWKWQVGKVKAWDWERDAEVVKANLNNLVVDIRVVKRRQDKMMTEPVVMTERK